VGRSALAANTTGTGNTAVGQGAGLAITTGDNNTIVGKLAGDAITTGAANVAIGEDALTATTTAGNNTAVGQGAMEANTEGHSNTAVGQAAGNRITTGDNNLCLGYQAGISGSPGGAVTTGDNQICLGDENVTNAHIQVDWTIASDERDKTDIEDLDVGLEFVNQLQPKTYRWDKRSLYNNNQNVLPDGFHKADQLDVGFLAQDVDDIERSLGFSRDDKTNLVSSVSEDGKMYGLKYSKFVPMLVNAIQELSAQVEELKSQPRCKCNGE